MFGSGMFQAMQRAKARNEVKQKTADEKLEESRKARAAEAAAGREKIKAQRDARDRVAAATAQALREEAERVEAERAAKVRAIEAYAALVRTRDPRAAARWYYLDDHGARQGPFEPSKMRGWFLDGHLAPDLRVAPTFDDGGRLPEPEDHETIEGTFDAPLNTSAFRTERKPEPLDEPPAPAPKRKRDDDDDEPAKTGDWLKDSLARQKKGIHSLRHDRHSGPAMLFDSHEA
mmetsp:Transcript_24505/g.75598  ORF Transcript_24505/g.75598 Transcript_24505/m.75598 type:complete len:232 (-) Transcript_24505:33-728(-)